jgi:hypothetical protein
MAPADHMSLQSEMVKHFSSEIESHSNYQSEFRSKIAFSVLVGPFVILGYLVATYKPTATNHWGCLQTWLSIAIGIVYLGIGFYGSRLDQHSIDQCNKWRRAILKISAGESVREEEISIGESALWAYLAGFIAVLAEFLLVGWLLLTLLPISAPLLPHTASAPTAPPTSASTATH